MHDIERELIKATGYKPQRKFSDRQDYLSSILNAVAKLSNDDFDDLSNEAAEWANAAVEAKNSKEEELPDFDEITASSTEDDGEDASEAEASGNVADETSEVEHGEEPDHDDEVPDEGLPKTKPSKTVAKSKPTKQKAEPKVDRGDAVVDKWGCIEGSKNSQALAMFEKGATTREVKETIGGTYYNILGKCVQQGHKLLKEGSLITLVHKSEIGKKPAPAKKGKK